MTRLAVSFPDMPALSSTGEDGPRLSGLAVPYGVDSAPAMDGNRYRFTGPPADGMEGVVVVREHDDQVPIGTVSASESTGTGLFVTVHLIDTTAGRDAHVEAAEGVRTGLSIAFDPIASTPADDGVIEVSGWTPIHLGHVRAPAFIDAQAVAASAQIPQGEEDTMPETETPETPAPAPVLSIAPRPVRVPTLAEYGHALATRDLARIERFVEAINLAAGDTLVTNVPGVIPTQILGPVIDARPYDSPIFNALGPSAGPSAGSSWTHPIVSDPIADAVAIAELTSAADTLGITSVSVSWVTIKRTTRVSRETQIFSDPAVMGIVGEQLARSYVRGREVIAAGGLTSATGGNTAISLAKNGSDAVAKLVAGSTIHYGQVGAPSDILFVNPTDYAQIAGWVGSDGRALFPSVGQIVNGSGETGGTTMTANIAGIQVIVSWALTSGQNYLVSSDYVKTYEGNRATISVELATFGVETGIFGTVAAKVLLPKAVTPVTISATELASTAKK